MRYERYTKFDCMPREPFEIRQPVANCPRLLSDTQTHTLAHRAYMHREVEQHTVRRWLMVPLKRPYQDGPPNRLRTKKQNQRRGHLVPYVSPSQPVSLFAW